MDRKHFLQTLGISAAAVVFINSIESCKKPDTTAKVDFTIDLSSSQFTDLNTVGGYAYQNGIIIAKTSNGDFVAVSQACTHQGCNVEYQLAQNDFACPCHGARFDSSGGVVNGPAMTALTKYNTSLSGTTLRIFA
ncbi:MAG: ubiquinol-cytochrome c reductase iron-sulfur subunit [Sphingobacteriales bacterium]|nr:MAG: ubiquinol-cytochrome c reductase iron-sulfur subunit [Sphingobacteriales bacterium]